MNKTHPLPNPPIRRGDLVRVTKCPTWEYLTVGETYRADNTPGASPRATLGLHRPNDGGGTYVNMRWVRSGHIVLEHVAA